MYCAELLEDLDGDETANELWETLCKIFGYDCEDEADDWWVRWGRLRERAQADDDGEEKEEGRPSFDFSAAMSVQVTSTEG